MCDGMVGGRHDFVPQEYIDKVETLQVIRQPLRTHTLYIIKRGQCLVYTGYIEVQTLIGQ